MAAPLCPGASCREWPPVSEGTGRSTKYPWAKLEMVGIEVITLIAQLKRAEEMNILSTRLLVFKMTSMRLVLMENRENVAFCFNQLYQT